MATAAKNAGFSDDIGYLSPDAWELEIFMRLGETLRCAVVAFDGTYKTALSLENAARAYRLGHDDLAKAIKRAAQFHRRAR